MKTQYTATIYVGDGQKVLLLFHRKMQKWLPPGGHLELGERPDLGALRELEEETGYTAELICDENIFLHHFNAHSFPRPYLCLSETIPATSKEALHLHLDFIYVGRPLKHYKTHEGQTYCWFTLAEIVRLRDDEEIFLETKKTIAHLFKNNVWEKKPFSLPPQASTSVKPPPASVLSPDCATPSKKSGF